MELGLVILLIAVVGLGTFFPGYPLVLWLIQISKRGPEGVREVSTPVPSDLPMISILLAARNAEAFVESKISNCLALSYPRDLLEILFFSDGSQDRTLEKALLFSQDQRVRIFHSDSHVGKIEALNRMAPEARGDILVFTDVDALLEPQCLQQFVSSFEDPRVGGVCGRRVIDRGRKHEGSGQRLYFDFAAWLQVAESRIGSVTANEGKIYAIRHSLFRPIAVSVTDDLFVCLSVVDQGYRFIFRPDILAEVPLPSKSFAHELRRRRRIVATSLRGIQMHARLLNPFRTGFFAYALFVNKILRRMIPIWLVCIGVANTLLIHNDPFWTCTLALQGLAYAIGIFHAMASGRGSNFLSFLEHSLIGKMLAVWVYFLVGNLGTLLGLYDYVRGRRVDKWEPEKSPFSDANHQEARREN